MTELLSWHQDTLIERFGFTRAALDLLEAEFNPRDIDNLLDGCLVTEKNARRLASYYNEITQ